MVSPVQMHFRRTRRGLYESFDYRGVSASGRYAFLLRHSVCRPWRGEGTITVALFCFDRRTALTRCVVERERLGDDQLRQLRRARHWEEGGFSFESGSFIEIGRDRLRGKLHTCDGNASWNLMLQRSDLALRPLPNPLYYHLPWPRYKVQTPDCFLAYAGLVEAGDLSLAGDFSGSSRHYWGDGYPYELASAQCNRFAGAAEAYFHGFSSRLSVGPFQSPYLSMASLRLDGRWHHFNDLWQSLRQPVEVLDNYRWRITLLNAEHGLEVEVAGANPRLLPWAGWQVEEPWGGNVVVKATPFASATLTLFRRRTLEPVTELVSDALELHTLLPENQAEGEGFWVTP